MEDAISTPLVLAWLLLFVVMGAVLFIGWLVLRGRKGFVNNVIVDESCSPPLPELIPAGTICCQIGGRLTNMRLISLQNGSEDVVISLNPLGYEQACAALCPNLDNQGNCINPTAEYRQCLALTEPVNCTGPANPIATDGVNYWYLYSANPNFCGIPAPCAPIP